MSLIEIKNLHKYYNHNKSSEVYALKGIDLSVNIGEMIAIMGPSGSGKSTLLHIIGCLDSFQEGIYLFDGEKVFEKSANELAELRNKKLGFVLQDFGLILSKTVRENISVPLIFNKNTKKKEIADIVDLALKDVELIHKASAKAFELSGGQKQRVAIARALVNRPICILADEPTGALDSKASSEIIDLLRRINQNGTTVIIVTHDINVATKCDRIINVVDGKIAE